MAGLNVLELNSRMAIRSEDDPNDKSTIVSIYPGPLVQNHLTIQPGFFYLPPGNITNPSILTIGSSSWWKATGEDEPIVEITHRSISIARSIITDWCNGLIEFNGDMCMPGLFYVQGVVDAVAIKTKYKNELALAKTKQENWFNALIKKADSLWARSNGNPLAVADIMKLAAREMGKSDRPWLQNYEQDSVEKCIACHAIKPSSAVVCATCGAITDTKRAEELGIKFVSK